jgi:hypothetical protein
LEHNKQRQHICTRTKPLTWLISLEALHAPVKKQRQVQQNLLLYSMKHIPCYTTAARYQGLPAAGLPSAFPRHHAVLLQDLVE